MMGTTEGRKAVNDEILITIHFANDTIYEQPVPVDRADDVQEFMDWYRDPKKVKTWAWHITGSSTIHLIRHEHIVAVDIHGYIEPDGRTTNRWQRLLDKITVQLHLLRSTWPG